MDTISAPASFISTVPYKINDLATSGCQLPNITIGSITASPATVHEGDTRIITVSLSQQTTVTTTLNIDLSPESADAGQDYSTNIEVSFDEGNSWSTVSLDSNGQVDASVPAGTDEVLIRVTAIQDTVTDDNETFDVSVAMLNDGSDQQGIQITIIDRPTAAQQELISLVPVSSHVNEGERLIFDGELSVALSTPTLLSLSLNHIDTTAIDISPTVELSFDGGITWPSFVNLSSPKDVSIPAGIKDFKIRVHALADNQFENDEEFTLSAFSLIGNNVTRVAAANIVDTTDTDPTVSTVEILPNPVEEGTNIGVMVTLSGPSDGNDNFLINITDIDTFAGEDYALIAQVSFNNGRSWQDVDLTNGGPITTPVGADSFIVQLFTNEDQYIEANETFEISVGREDTPNEQISEIITIIDITAISKPTVDSVVMANDGVVIEGEMLAGTVMLSAATQEMSKYYFSLTDNSAQVNLDYSANIQVSFDNGVTWSSDIDLSSGNEVMVDANISSFMFRVTALDDSIIDDGEHFTVSVWSDPSQTNQAVDSDIEIADATLGDLPGIGDVTAQPNEVIEGESLTYTITLDKPAIATTALHLDLMSGAAIINDDISSSVEVSFDNGATWQTIDLDATDSLSIPVGVDQVKVRVTALNDLIVEPNEDFDLNVWVKPDGSDAVNTSVDVIDATPLIIIESLAASPESVEEGSEVTFDVRLSVQQNNAPLYINLDDISANVGSDYSDLVQISLDSGATWTSLDLSVTDHINLPLAQTLVKIKVLALEDMVEDDNETFKITLRPAQTSTEQATTTVTIIDTTNSAPVANDDSATIDENTQLLNFDVLANDTDVDNDTLTISGTPTASHGTVIVNLDGTISYTPDANYHGLDTIAYMVTDGELADEGEVTIQITSVNGAPIAVDDTANATEDTPLNNINVLANDTDSDGDALSIDGIPTANNGTVTVNTDGSLNYTPNPNFNGVDTITYTVTDGTAIDIGTVNVSVASVNDVPVANPDTANATEDQPLTNIDVLSNDSDVENDPLSIVGTPMAEHGTVTVNPDGTLNYTPDPDYFGSDVITYTVTDGSDQATSTVAVSVAGTPDAPVAENDIATTNEDQAVFNISVLANDVDADDDVLSISGIPTALNGTVTVNQDGTLNYTPNANFNGTDTIHYVVTDGALSDSASVSVVVNSVNDSPVAVDDHTNATEDQPLSNINVLANDVDHDGDALAIVGIPTALHGTVTVNSDGTLNYMPEPDYFGPDQIQYTVTDGTSSDTGVVYVNVDGTPDAPLAVDDVATATEDETLSNINVLANDTDADGDVLEIQGIPTANHGTVTVNADGTLNYTPDPDFYGTDIITYIVTDGEETDSGEVAIAVLNTNEAPNAVDDNATLMQIGVTASNYTGLSQTCNKVEQLNQTTSRDDSPKLTLIGNNGDYAVTWRGWSGPVTAGTTKVGLQLFNADGTKKGSVVKIGTTNHVTFPSINSLNDQGDFMVNWTGVNTSTAEQVAYTQRFYADGSKDQIITLGNARQGTLSADVVDGKVVYMWQLAGSGIYKRVINSDHTVGGTQYLGSGTLPKAHTLKNGRYLLTWHPNTSQTKTQMFDQNDNQIGNTLTANIGVGEVTAIGENGDYAIFGIDSSRTRADVVKVDSNNQVIDGTAQSTSLTGTSNYGTGGISQLTPDGTFLIGWTGKYEGNWVHFVQHFDANGAKDQEMQIVPHLEGEHGGGHGSGRIANVGDNGDYVRAWSTISDVTTTSNYDVFTQRFDSDGNKIGPKLRFTGENSARNDLSVNILSKANSGAYSIAFMGYDSAANGSDESICVSNIDANDNVDTDYQAGESGDFDIYTQSADTPYYMVNYSTGTLVVNGVTYASGSQITYDVWDDAITDRAVQLIDAVGEDFDLEVHAFSGFIVQAGASLDISAQDLLSNDSDPDGDPLQIGSVQDAQHGSVTLNTDGSITFTADIAYQGEATFTYTISDGQGGMDTATVTVNVVDNNHAPTAGVDVASMTQGTTLMNIDILANDQDVDGDTLSLFNTPNSSNGVVTVNANGTVNFTPDSSFVGLDIIQYVITDHRGGFATGQLYVQVNQAVPTTTSFSLAQSSVSATEGQPLTFRVYLNEVISNDAVLNLSTTNISATSGSDFTLNNSQITIPAGEQYADIVIPTIDDSTVESQESFRLNVVGANNVSGNGSALGYINDNDVPLAQCMTVSGNGLSFAPGVNPRVEHIRHALDNQRFIFKKNGSNQTGWVYPTDNQWKFLTNGSGGNTYSVTYEYDKSNNGHWQQNQCRARIISAGHGEIQCDDIFLPSWDDTIIKFTYSGNSNCQ